MRFSLRFAFPVVLMAVAPAVALGAEPAAKSPARIEDMIAVATRDPKTLAASVDAGAKVAEFCAHCHGPNGNSTYPAVPNLAGQNAGYLLEQIQKYLGGQRRDEYKQGLIKLISAQDRIHLAVYYAQQRPIHQPVADPKAAASGKQLYDDLCSDCHGDDGRGDEKLARVAGQQREYLTVSIKRYRDHSGERSDPKMARIVRTLGDGEIQSLVLYMSSMQ